MNKKLIRLTESDLHRIVKESVNKIINEIGDTEKGQRALGALTAAKFKGKKKGDWGEVAKKSSDERDKASNKAAKSGYNKNEPWSSLMAWHKKRASMSDAYNNGFQKQVNESGFYPMEYDSKIGYYTPNGTVDGIDTYIDFDEMSFSELKALRDKYLEQVGHTPWNKIANVRPDIFNAVNAIEEELEERRERYREGDESTIDYWRQAEDNYLMQEKLPRGWEKRKCDDVFGGFIYTDEDYNEYYKDQYGRFQPLDNEF